MDALVGLDDVDWTLLVHAYGPAIDVPVLLRRLATPNLSDEDLQGIIWTFYGNIYHQGTRYPATVATIPFLLSILDAPTMHAVRAEIISLLVHLAVSDPSWLLPHNFDIKARRAKAEQMQSPTFAEEALQAKADWIVQAPDEATREERQHDAVLEIEWSLQDALLQLRVHDAVKEGLPIFRRCLSDASASAHLRALAIYAIAWFPEEIESSQQVLFDVLEREQVVGVRATACIALGLLQAPEMAEEKRLPKESIISLRLSTLFERDGTDDLIRFSCALGIALSGIAEDRHLDELLRKINNAAYLQEHDENDDPDAPVFPFAGSNIATLATSALGTVKGSAHPSVPLALAKALASSSQMSILTLTKMALQTAFDGERREKMPPFEQLTEPQQAVVRALTQVAKTNWSFVNYLIELREWGLPSELKELWAYAQMEGLADYPDVPDSFGRPYSPGPQSP
ncbi:hypothetical protein C8F01DRAFT_613514 [Mycena amicta]|nr:hypothetical protein C8F01DRAFT_613514 [Mycena amicta]